MRKSKPIAALNPEYETPPPSGRVPDAPDDALQEPYGGQAAPDGGTATPSMARFLEIKAANPDSLLWYRMGDFYELFFEDAVVASKALGIALTKRGKHYGADIPMCGVPVVRADDYLQRLIKQGFRVAVCEQLEDPAEARKRGAKSVVRRDVVRLVTPGTLTEDALLEAKARNYLTAMFVAGLGDQAIDAPGTDVALASIDISTGEFEVTEISGSDLSGELARLAPSEILCPDGWLGRADIQRFSCIGKAATTPMALVMFDSASGTRQMKAHLGVAELGAFGQFSRGELAAVGALLKYVELTQLGKRPMLRPPRRTGNGALMLIDAATRSSLELLRSTSGEQSGSLIAAIDRTVTGAGARELAARLASPLAEVGTINARLDAVAYLADRPALRDALRQTLKSAPDLARAVARLAFARGGPRDLGAVRDGLEIARLLYGDLTRSGAGLGLPAELQRIADGLATAGSAGTSDLEAILARALANDLPVARRDGGFVKAGYRMALDDARRLRDDSRSVMARLEARYVNETGIKTLKIRHNNILGFFVEVTQQNAKPLQSEPLVSVFRHRQTMANAMRFTTIELAETEGQIASATERALAIEQEVFCELSALIAADEAAIGAKSAALAEIDHMAALSLLAEEQGYVRPIVDDSTAFDVTGGRHAVVEQALSSALAGAFIENDCELAADDAPAIWLVTGPNMAGKSTFLRQNALIAILAQMGSFVPARTARVGVVDRLYSRVGAADDLARGRSTFMVEMVETAAILNSATSRSFVILDEIGRGTATFDGLSIAWATVEYLHDVTKARALFATHYHELTALDARLARIRNVTMDVKEWQDDIVFLHKIKPGAADRSYGIQVAKLAGLPHQVVARAKTVLSQLERSANKTGKMSIIDDLPLFASVAAPIEKKRSALDDALDALKPDEMSPKDALDFLYKLQKLRPMPAGEKS